MIASVTSYETVCVTAHKAPVGAHLSRRPIQIIQ